MGREYEEGGKKGGEECVCVCVCVCVYWCGAKTGSKNVTYVTLHTHIANLESRAHRQV